MPLIPRPQSAEETTRQLTELAQPHVPEPVTAVGMLQPAGSWGAFGAGQASPLLGSILRHQHDKAAGGLARTGMMKRSQMAMIALTEGRVYALGATYTSGGWAIGDAIGNWDRSDLHVETIPVAWPRRSSSTSCRPVSATSSRPRRSPTAVSPARSCRP